VPSTSDVFLIGLLRKMLCTFAPRFASFSILMYSKTEAAQIRQAFWTTLGQYMRPVLSAEGVPANWINYKTGIKHVYFRMHADTRRASIGIELTHPDAGIRELFFEQFRELRTMLEEAAGETWTWEADATDEYGQPLSRIYQELTGVNMFNREDWPRLISFFKPRLVALDEFWSSAQYAFDELK
jgi:hypothetical protein